MTEEEDHERKAREMREDFMLGLATALLHGLSEFVNGRMKLVARGTGYVVAPTEFQFVRVVDHGDQMEAVRAKNTELEEHNRVLRSENQALKERIAADRNTGQN